MPPKELLSYIDVEIAFQRRWRKWSAWGYFTVVGVSIGAAAAATVVAGVGIATEAAVLAAVTTIATSLEHSLRFRERWTHHRTILAELNSLRAKCEIGGITQASALADFERISSRYARDYPVEERPVVGD